MATRSGTVDPGLVLWLEEHEHLSPHEVATALEERSGLNALAGTGDIREVEAAAPCGDADAARNDTTSDDGDISGAGASARTVVVTAREDLHIAREVRQLLGG